MAYQDLPANVYIENGKIVHPVGNVAGIYRIRVKAAANRPAGVAAEGVFTFDLAANFPVQILIDGDSLEWGDKLTSPSTQSFPAQLKTKMGTVNYGDWLNAGVNGQRVDQMLADQQAQILSRKNTSLYKSHILYVGGGINDITQGESVEEVYNDLKAYHQAAVAAGWRTIAATHTAYNSLGYLPNVTQPQIEDNRQALDRLICANWKDDFGAMALIDLGADPHIGIYNLYDFDRIYFNQDGGHFTVFGAGYKADLVQPGVEAVALGNIYGMVTPLPPDITANDTTNTLSASHYRYASNQIMVREAGGAWVTYTGSINVGPNDRPSGYWEFKIVSATGRNESPIVKSPAFFAGEPVVSDVSAAPYSSSEIKVTFTTPSE